MFPTHDMNPRAVAAMLEERERRYERALETARPPNLPAAGPLICAALILVAATIV